MPARSSAKKAAATAAASGDFGEILNAFRSLVKALRSADVDAVQSYGLGSAQIFVLHCLYEREPLSVAELAQITATDQSTVSIIVSKLAGRGLVDRSRSEEDARRAELSLTREGRALARRVPRAFQQSFIAALEQLSDQRRRTLASLLREVVVNMGIDEPNPPMLLMNTRTPRAASKKATAKRPPKSG